MISENVLKMSSIFWKSIKIQRPTQAYLFIETTCFFLHLIGIFIGFNLIYWTPVSGFQDVLIWKNVEIFGKTAVFSGRADMAGLGKYCMGRYGRIGVYRVKEWVINGIFKKNTFQRRVYHNALRLKGTTKHHSGHVGQHFKNFNDNGHRIR